MPTHGSLSKAGKVRDNTPKVQARVRKSPSPKMRNKHNYRKREIENQPPGQHWRGPGYR